MSVALPTSSASEFAEQQYWDTFFVEVRSLRVGHSLTSPS
jgi:hypothetical protein